MNLLLIAIILIPCLVQAQSTHREASAEEKKVLLSQDDEKKLKTLGTELNQESERNLLKEAMVKEALDNGKLDDIQMKSYIQKLTDQSLSPENINEEKEDLSRKYYAKLQMKELEKVLPIEKQKEYEKKFTELQLKSENGTLTHEQLDKEISLLDAEISNSEETKKNEIKLSEFKTAFKNVQKNNKFEKGPSTLSDKQFTPIKVMVPMNFSLKDYQSTDPLCLTDSGIPFDSQLDQLNTQMQTITTSGKDRKPSIHQIYFAWGYNRGWHTNSDVKFTTPNGTFTIHDTKSKDRPSPFSVEDYFKPQNLSIPQYNMELGIMFNEKWGMEIKQDHMKMVFDNTRPYEITGDYSHQVVIKNDHPTNEWDQQIPVDFSVAKAKKDATWLHWEHTDGYIPITLEFSGSQNFKFIG